MTAHAGYSLQERWYLCELGDTSSDVEEPDWSRVPDAKRETVRARWRTANTQRRVDRVLLWGPQIPFFARQPYYDVRVLTPAIDNHSIPESET